jgi:uncharacterized hydrophobic protein (TIGR00271 family)
MIKKRMKEKEKEQERKIEESKKDIKGLLANVKIFLKELLSIRKTTDVYGTIQSIKDSISMKGHTAWILVFSIIIASIGLHVSSTAVVIGAMLISPLMGPILGVGLSIGINDIDTLKKSMVNLGVMLSLSLFTSFLFFSIPLFQEETKELLARTQPNVLDVMIAISGGLALIIAISRPQQQINTVAGVAIATALMPPLCTAGFSLATNQYNYFLGAMFLFLINATFIALSTFVIVKYLRFPMVRYINSVKRRRIARFASFIAIVILTASIYTFYNLYLEKKFKQQAITLIEQIKNEGYSVIDEDESDLDFKNKIIDITVFGKSVSQDVENRWKQDLISLGMDNDVKLYVHKGKDDSKLINEFQALKEQVARDQKIIEERDFNLRNKDQKINMLEKEIFKLKANHIPFLKLSEEAKINYDGIKEIAFSNKLITNFKHVDTIPVFSVKWFDSIPSNKKILQEQKMRKWIKARLELDTLILE